MKILLYDIETFPNIGYSWGKWEQNIIEFKREWELASFAYKWLGDAKTTVVTRQGQRSDKELVKKLHSVLAQADMLIAHNGIAFDNKKARAKFIEHGLAPLAPIKTIDTRNEARKHFAFNSNKLDDIAKLLKVGRKVKTGGFDLWTDCMAGVPAAWKKMAEYNKQDVQLLERVYLKMRPFIKHPPSEHSHSCPACNSLDLQKRGYSHTKASLFSRYQCKDCGAWSQSAQGTRRAIPRQVNGL